MAKWERKKRRERGNKQGEERAHESSIHENQPNALTNEGKKEGGKDDGWGAVHTLGDGR